MCPTTCRRCCPRRATDACCPWPCRRAQAVSASCVHGPSRAICGSMLPRRVGRCTTATHRCPARTAACRRMPTWGHIGAPVRTAAGHRMCPTACHRCCTAARCCHRRHRGFRETQRRWQRSRALRRLRVIGLRRLRPPIFLPMVLLLHCPSAVAYAHPRCCTAAGGRGAIGPVGAATDGCGVDAASDCCGATGPVAALRLFAAVIASGRTSSPPGRAWGNIANATQLEPDGYGW